MGASNENIRRAERAYEALQSYEPSCPSACLSGDVLVDLLCDLMHWSREHDEDFAESLKLAQEAFDAEVGQEQEADDAKHGEE